MQRREFVRLAGALGASGVAGCLGGGKSTPTTATATMTETPTESPSPEPTGVPKSAQEQYPDYKWSKLEGVDPTATDTITMKGTAFHPLVAAVSPGSTVTVDNEDGYRHTFSAPRLGIKESVSGGGSTSFTVEQTGRFDYVCTLHPPGMLGRLVVTENPATATATPTGTPTETPTSTPTQTTVSATVDIMNTSYNPERVSVAPGETVQWVNKETGAYSDHTVTATRFHDKAASWEMDVTLASGESVTHTFSDTGIYEYYCTIHGKESMCGAVLVGDVTLDESLPCEG